ncbi:DNA replication/repair protein RecF [Phosphitispora sp. TUW77]|uniref:DNA replication/repair protein RecF n=1 Tax=Phosphitispora sp. TUW77 TaxID=3152361 RepID=UPI003AB8A2F7
MLVNGISLHNYRNYQEIHVDFHQMLNIIIGRNAQGKTNLLEAIFYTVTGKSHRTGFDSELIFWGEKNFRIILNGERFSGKVKIEILTRSDGKKVLKVNGQPKKKLSELIGIINAVLFSPEDMMLVKGGPSIRRRYLDIEISQVSKYYCNSLVNYNRILLQRNSLLKAVREGEENEELLNIWDKQLAEYGVYIIKKRNEVIKKLIPIAKKIHLNITEGNEELNLIYEPSINISMEDFEGSAEDNFLKKLKVNRKAEILKGITLSGPHRDDIDIKIGNINVKSFGSQGQQRTSALSMKLSEIEFMKNETGDYPILLLDDVMSELDSNRRKYFLNVVKGRVQTFVTSTGIKDVFDTIIDNSRIFEAQSGNIIILQEG